MDAKADYNIPEYWRSGTSVDDKFLDSFSSPRGIVKEVREALGADRICTWAFDIKEDRQNTDAALYILDKKMAPALDEKPIFMSMYYASLDTNAHHRCWDSQEAMDTLESIDKMVGDLTARFEKLTKGKSWAL